MSSSSPSVSLCFFHSCTGTSTTADAVSIVSLVNELTTTKIVVMHGKINSIVSMMIVLKINRSYFIGQAQNFNAMWREFISLLKSHYIIINKIITKGVAVQGRMTDGRDVAFK